MHRLFSRVNWEVLVVSDVVDTVLERDHRGGDLTKDGSVTCAIKEKDRGHSK